MPKSTLISSTSHSSSPSSSPAESSGDGAPGGSTWKLVALGMAVTVLLLVAGAVGFSQSNDEVPQAAPPAAVAPFVATFRASPGAPLTDLIAQLQAQLESTPNDYVSWATLGLAYVQQARISVNPTFYNLAEGALDQSFEANDDDNFLGYAGRSSLASARHEFALAKQYALEGIEINEFSALLWGALGDAETQLGNYEAAAEHVQRMVDLSPDTASLARVSYTWELRGDLTQATAQMNRALEVAPTPDDRAFALYFLGELAFGQGDADAALGYYNEAVRVAPADIAASAGRAKALAATGQLETAVDAYAALVERVPDPAYLTAYGALLQSLGREAEAEEQFGVVQVTRALYRTNGVQPDAAEILFLADHGDPAEALELVESASVKVAFLAEHDAYAWALYRNGRFEEALEQSRLALATGIQNASYLYHSGMIQKALGNTAEAIAELSAALDLNPHFDLIGAVEAAETLAELAPNSDDA